MIKDESLKEDIIIPLRREFSITVENVTLQLIVDVNTQQTTTQLELPIMAHTHAYAEIFVCCDGTALIDTESGSISLKKGSILVVPSYYKHTLKRTESNGIWCAVGILPLRKRTRNSNNLYGILANLCFSKNLLIKEDCLDLCNAVYTISNSVKLNKYSLPALDMLQILLKIAEIKANANSVYSNDCANLEINRISQLEHVIASSFNLDVTVEDIAKKLFLSKRHLERICKKRFGCTVHQCIINKRLDASIKLLTESNMSVETISTTVGFKSKSAFYRMFYNRFGLTPTQYKNK